MYVVGHLLAISPCVTYQDSSCILRCELFCIAIIEIEVNMSV